MKQFARGDRGGVLTTSMPSAANTSSNVAGVLAVPVADQEPEPAGLFGEVHDEVAGLLHDPRSVRMRGDAEQVDASGGHVHHDQHVQPFEQDRVDVEEVDREQPVSLGA